jgi:hypothetical protein
MSTAISLSRLNDLRRKRAGTAMGAASEVAVGLTAVPGVIALLMDSSKF